MITNMTDLKSWVKYSYFGIRLRSLNNSPDAINSIALIIALVSIIPLIIFSMITVWLMGWSLALLVLMWGMVRIWQKHKIEVAALEAYRRRNMEKLIKSM